MRCAMRFYDMAEVLFRRNAAVRHLTLYDSNSATTTPKISVSPKNNNINL